MAADDNNESAAPSTEPIAAVSDVSAKQPAKPRLLTKRDLLLKLTTSTGLTKKQVQGVLNGMHDVLVTELRTNSVVTLPGLLKIKVVTKAATHERQSINPATRQPTTIPPKPARKDLKSFPLKVLKDTVL